MRAEQTERFLTFCCEMGRHLIQNGAEIYRVEEAAARMLAAYGYREVEVFAIPSVIILNIQAEDRSHTKAVRIRASANNLDKLDRLNALCRRVCRETPPAEEAEAMLRDIVEAPAYPAWVSYLGHGVGAAFFTLFWGGGGWDALTAFFCGLAVRATVGFLRRRNTNIFFTNVCASMLLMAVPLALIALGCPLRLDMIVIGAIMLLVPGIAITNVMRDVIAGDFLTALTKFAEVMIVSMAIAIGIAIPVGLARLLGGL